MTLTIQDLGALGELLGSVAVLATLVYLAMQTRQVLPMKANSRELCCTEPPPMRTA